jgi:hypothetical protein
MYLLQMGVSNVSMAIKYAGRGFDSLRAACACVLLCSPWLLCNVQLGVAEFMRREISTIALLARRLGLAHDHAFILV